MDWRALTRLRGRSAAADEAPELDHLQVAGARASTPAQRVEWVRGALRWIEKDFGSRAAPGGIARAHTRLRFLLQTVDRDTDGGRALRAVLTGLLADINLEQLTAVATAADYDGVRT